MEVADIGLPLCTTHRCRSEVAKVDLGALHPQHFVSLARIPYGLMVVFILLEAITQSGIATPIVFWWVGDSVWVGVVGVGGGRCLSKIPEPLLVQAGE